MEVYQAMCPGGEAEAFAQHVFRTFDKDKNGFIDFKVQLYIPPNICWQILLQSIYSLGLTGQPISIN